MDQVEEQRKVARERLAKSEKKREEELAQEEKEHKAKINSIMEGFDDADKRLQRYLEECDLKAARIESTATEAINKFQALVSKIQTLEKAGDEAKTEDQAVADPCRAMSAGAHNEWDGNEVIAYLQSTGQTLELAAANANLYLPRSTASSRRGHTKRKYGQPRLLGDSRSPSRFRILSQRCKPKRKMQQQQCNCSRHKQPIKHAHHHNSRHIYSN